MFRNPQGFGILTTEGKVVEEVDTFTCFHCSRIVDVPAKAKPEDMGSMCKVCMKLVCKFCATQGCKPFFEKFERMERRQRALRSYGT